MSHNDKKKLEVGLENEVFKSFLAIMKTGYNGHFEKFINYHYIEVALYIHEDKWKSNLPKIKFICRWCAEV